MRTFSTAILLTLSIIVQAAQSEAAGPEKVLMVGDSYIYVYKIPVILEALAKSSGKKLTVTQHVGGSKSLVWHWTNKSPPDMTTAPEAMAKEHWDMVILEEGNVDFKKPEDIAAFKTCTRDYVDLAAKTKTQVLFYTGIWMQYKLPYLTPEAIKPGMDMYTQQADALTISCSPVALAFLHCQDRAPLLAVFDCQKDQNKKLLKYGLDKMGWHQSPFGAYLAACTLYASIYDQSPVGNKAHSSGDGTTVFDEVDATIAQQVAWDTWNAYKVTLKATPKAVPAKKK